MTLLLSIYDFNNTFYEDIFELFKSRLIENLSNL